MKKHTCKQCSKVFEYCRGCLLSPIPYKDAGYCSKTCYEKSKMSKIEEVVREDVEVVVVKEDTPTSKEEIVEYPYFFAEATIEETEEKVNIKPKKKKNKNVKKENVINDYEQGDPQNL